MLGYVLPSGRGQGDALLIDVAEHLLARGIAVTGVVQVNLEHDPDKPCHMDLRLLGQPETIRISQDRGRLARGCRLDSGSLAMAVHQVKTAIATNGARLLIVNKFGKQECEGEGFRDVIAEALGADMAVLTTVSARHLQGFVDFAAGFETPLPFDRDRVIAWCVDQVSRRCAAAVP